MAMKEKNNIIASQATTQSLYQDACVIMQSLTAKSQDDAQSNILQSLTAKSPIRLSWTHYSIILQENSKEARDWYEQEAAREMWGTRTLQRNLDFKTRNEEVE